VFGCVQYVQFSVSTVSIAYRCVHIRSGTSWDTDGTLANGCAPVSRRPDRGDPVKLSIGWPGYPTSPCRSTGRASLASRASVSALAARPDGVDPHFGSAGCLPASFRRRRVRRRLARVTWTSRGGEHRRYVPPAWAGRYPNAQRLAEAVVAADPLREAMWRTLMRVRSAVGDYDGVVSTFAISTRATGRQDRARGGHPCPAGPAAPLNTRFGAFTSGRRH
jgi:hypothetical protein